MHAIAFEEAWHVYLAAARYMPPPAPAVMPQRIAGVLDVAADFDALVFDAYGVLNNGNRAIAPALAAMRALRDMGKAVCILTNDASGDKEAIAAGHRGRGYDISVADIIAGIDLLPETLAGLPDTAGFGVMAHFGLPYPHLLGPMARLDSDEAVWDAVDGMIFLDAQWTTAQRDMLVRTQHRRPRPMIVCNPDVACPIEDALSAEPGYFLHAVTEATGVAVTWLGKPHVGVYERVAERYPDIPRGRMLAVGDTPHTDILGARSVGMRALLVESGFCHGQDSLALCEEGGVWPDFIAPHL